MPGNLALFFRNKFFFVLFFFFFFFLLLAVFARSWCGLLPGSLLARHGGVVVVVVCVAGAGGGDVGEGDRDLQVLAG